MLKNFYYKKKKKCMAVHDRLKFIEELKNIKELTLAGTSYPFNQHIIKYTDILIGIYEKEVKQYEDDMWEEHMSKKRNPTYHSFHENFTPDLWKNAKKELEEKTTVFDENDFEENNYEDLCTHEDWTDEDDMRYHQCELERKLDQVDLELQHEKLMG